MLCSKYRLVFVYVLWYNGYKWIDKEVRTVGMVFKINVLQALKDKGYSTYRIKNEKLLSQSTLQKLREGKPVSWENIEAFCRLLELQPGELLEYKPDTAEND